MQEIRLQAVGEHSLELPAGLWYWRMASLDDRGERRLWGRSHSLLVRPLPAAPAPAEVRTEAGQAHLAWLPVAGAARYALEVGKGPDLTPVLHRQETADTRVSLVLKPARYFWRVRGLEVDGLAGPWSQASPFVLMPPPPTALEARQQGAELQVHWQGEAAGYRLEVAGDARFSRLLAQVQSSQPAARLTLPGPGTYWLRVIALGDDAVESLPSPALVVEVRRLVPWWLIPMFLLPVGM